MQKHLIRSAPENLKEIKLALRAKYAWPGGYPLYFITADGEALSIDAARKNWRQIVWAQLTRAKRSGWFISYVTINWEDSDLYCGDSGARIESAYCD